MSSIEFDVELLFGLWTVLDFMTVSAVRDPFFDRKASLVVRTSLIFLDFILPHLSQVLLDLFPFIDKVLFDLRVLVVTAFLVENFMRFAFCQQSSVDWVATTRPNCCFHLVKVLIG